MATPQAVLVRVAQAVTDALAAQDFGFSPWEPVRSYADFDEKLTDLKQLHIDVVPNQARESELSDRGDVLYKCPIDIGIRKRFQTEDQQPGGRIDLASIDELVLLAEQIHEFFLSAATQRLPTITDAIWTETLLVNSYNRDHLRQHSQFTALVRVSYEVPKALA